MKLRIIFEHYVASHSAHVLQPPFFLPLLSALVPAEALLDADTEIPVAAAFVGVDHVAVRFRQLATAEI